MEKKDRYHLAIDVMRAIAILAVVCIHTTTQILSTSHLDITHSYLAFFFNQISRFAVPLFFMISGFVLEVNYPFHQSYISYLNKRISRILIPYLFWSAIYYCFVYTRHSYSYFQAVLTGDASYQLYFIPALILFYIIFPFLHRFYPYFLNRISLIILGVVQIAFLSEDYYWHGVSIVHPLAIVLLNYYIFILGMLAARYHKVLSEHVVRWKMQYIFLLVVFAIFVVQEGKLFFLNTHNYLFFYSQWRPSVLIYTILVFAVLYAFSSYFYKHMRVILLFSRLSFFIYFVHVIVMEIFWNMWGRNLLRASYNQPYQQFWFDAMFFIIVIIFSGLLAYIAHKIKYLRIITG